MKAKSQAKSDGVPVPRRKSGQFVKGVSGNPNGRPRAQATALRDSILEFLALPDARQPKLTSLQTLIARLYVEDPKTLLAYGFGKPVETHEISGRDGEALINPEVLALAKKVASTL